MKNCEHPINKVHNRGYLEGGNCFVYWCQQCGSLGELTREIDIGQLKNIKWIPTFANQGDGSDV